MTIYVTQAGLDRLKADLRRKQGEFDEICAERSVAHELSGDGWHDNPHFNRLQQLEANKSRELAAVQQLIARARIVTIADATRPIDQVAIGAIVRLRISYEDSADELLQTWEITGFNENDFALRRLAYNAPLAAAIMGARPGDELDVQLPRGAAFIEILELLPSRHDMR